MTVGIDNCKILCDNQGMQRIDKTLIEKVNNALYSIKNGDKDAVALLFELTYKQLYHVAFKYSKDKFAAEDLTADIFANIDYIAGKYSKGKNAFNYLCKIIKNRYLNFVRYRKLHDTGELLENTAAVFDEADKRVTDMCVKEALKSLDKEEFEIINLKFYADMTFREIAAVKCISLGKVQRIYSRASEKLKKLL